MPKEFDAGVEVSLRVLVDAGTHLSQSKSYRSGI